MIETYHRRGGLLKVRRDADGFLADAKIADILSGVFSVEPLQLVTEVRRAIIAAALILDEANAANELGGRVPYTAYPFWQPLNARVLAALMLAHVASNGEATFSGLAERIVNLRYTKVILWLNSVEVASEEAKRLLTAVATELGELDVKHRDYVLIELRSVAWAFICGTGVIPIDNLFPDEPSIERS